MAWSHLSVGARLVQLLALFVAHLCGENFGQLLWGWGILLNPMRCTLPVVTKTVRVCAKLHDL